MTNWTKFSDRLPPEEQEQVFILWPQSGRTEVHNKLVRTDWHGWRTSGCSWHPITYPELPKREEIQRDRDEAAFNEARKTACASPSFGDIQGWMHDGWMQALAWERAENAKDLRLVSDIAASGVETHRPAIIRLWKRHGIIP
jgi:hypothetical protein